MFAGLRHHETREAYSRLSDAVAEFRRLSCGVNISLCELADVRLPENLRLQSADLPWLDAWAENLGPPGQLDFGFVAGLFLLRASERNRRFAKPGEVWAEAFCGYPCETLAILMLNSSTPSHVLADALEEIVSAWKLRNALEYSGVQKWYRTIMMQFGMTKGSFGKIPSWLGPLATQSNDCGSTIINLLKSGQMVSPSFIKFLSVLKKYRRKEITVLEALKILVVSPWVVPELLNNLLNHTNTNMHIHVADDDEATSFADFMAPVLLHWNSGNPEFITHLKPVSTDDALLEKWHVPAINVVAGSQPLGRLNRNPDGSYAPVNAGNVLIKAPAASLAIRLETRGGLVIHSVVAELFDDEDPVAWFLPSRAANTFCNNSPPAKVQSMIIRTPPQWVVRGAESHRSGPCGCTYWRVLAGTANVAVLDPYDAIHWLPGESKSTSRKAEGNLALLNPNHHGHVSELHIRSRFRPALVAWDNHNQVIRASWPADPAGKMNPGGIMAVDAELLRSGIQLTCTVQKPNVRRTMVLRPTENPNLSIFGVLRHADSWQEVDPGKPANANALGRTPYHIAVGSPIMRHEKNCPINLMEGSRSHRTLLGRKKMLPRLDGLGERVSAHQEENSIVLYEALYQGGSVDQARLEKGTLIIDLLHQSERDCEKHSVIIWDEITGIRSFCGSEIMDGDDHRSLRVQLPGSFSPRCAALAYEGVALGWAPVGALSGLMRQVTGKLLTSTPEEALELFAICRWFPLPVLMETGDIRTRMVQGANRHGLAFLKAWLSDAGLPAGLAYDPNAMAFRRRWDVTSCLLVSWRPSQDEVPELSPLLFPDIEKIKTPENWIPLITWNPAIAAFLMDAVRFFNTRNSRKDCALVFLAALGGGDDDPPVCDLVRAWRDSSTLAPMTDFFK